mmetsp:Transcript_44208/g.138555  ORF Transcript_44208/g.138555 Transcript_44208/m.138555 type:complete len:408 (+) Transcript_44208:615-1838(+)
MADSQPHGRAWDLDRFRRVAAFAPVAGNLAVGADGEGLRADRRNEPLRHHLCTAVDAVLLVHPSNKTYIAGEVLLRTGARLLHNWTLELLAVPALRCALSPRVSDLLAQEAPLRARPVRGRPSLVVRRDGVGSPGAGARGELQGVKLHVINHAHALLASAEHDEGGGSHVGLRDDVVHLEGSLGDGEVEPRLALAPAEDHLRRLLEVVGHHDEAAVVAKLVNEGALVRLQPGEAAIPGQEGARLLRFEPQHGADIASPHDDPDCGLAGIEGGVEVPGCCAMQVQRARLYWLALTLVGLPHAVHFRRLEVAPGAALVEGDDRADRALLLRGLRRLAPAEPPAVLLVHFRTIRGLLFHILRGPLLRLPVALICRAVRDHDVCHVDALEADHLVKLALALGGADIVHQRL